MFVLSSLHSIEQKFPKTSESLRNGEKYIRSSATYCCMQYLIQKMHSYAPTFYFLAIYYKLFWMSIQVIIKEDHVYFDQMAPLCSRK